MRVEQIEIAIDDVVFLLKKNIIKTVLKYDFDQRQIETIIRWAEKRIANQIADL